MARVPPSEVRNFMNRRNGIMRKANALYRKHNARAAVLLEWNGTTFCYKSDANWPDVGNLQVLPTNCFSPDNFETVADRTTPSTKADASGSAEDALSGGILDLAALHETPTANETGIENGCSTVFMTDSKFHSNPARLDALEFTSSSCSSFSTIASQSSSTSPSFSSPICQSGPQTSSNHSPDVAPYSLQGPQNSSGTGNTKVKPARASRRKIPLKTGQRKDYF
ncbi:hypothetical protein F5Y06DRAFT_274159 [Hypoxylon sp. FL0890]|nr:hypothetical protein F5Y06DRAFT_274159 [Hypoxylon sp. FL0890]